ncbi:MAG: hypothetical protein ACR2IJ_00060 [Fluviibacter sp.]
MELERAKPAIDLTRHHFSRDVGDLSIFGTWLYNDDQEDTEPCLVVIPRYRREGFKPVVVALSAAYRYNNPKYLAHAASAFAQSLGYESDLSQARKVATLIYDHLLDLLTMPLDPTEASVIGEVTIDQGGNKRTIEVLDYEQQRG